MNLDDIADDQGYESASTNSDESASNSSDPAAAGLEDGDQQRLPATAGSGDDDIDESQLPKQQFDDIELEWVQGERSGRKVSFLLGP